MKLKSIYRLNIRLAFLILALSTSARSQQLFSYAQYMNNLTPLNPAYSLIDKAGSINAVLRKQWAGISGAPSTFIFNGNLPFKAINAAGGLVVLNDQFALESLTEINAFFAKGISLSENHYLGVSLNAGTRIYRANYSSLDDTDPQFKDDVKETKPNIGFGIMYYAPSFYVGVAVPEFTTRSLGTASSTNSNNFLSHYNFSAAYLFGKEDGDIRLKPALLTTYSKGIPLIADISTTIYLKSTLGIGANYRTNNEMTGILTYYSNMFKLGYSYQFGTEGANIAQGFKNNSHEVTLSYRFGSLFGNKNLL